MRPAQSSPTMIRKSSLTRPSPSGSSAKRVPGNVRFEGGGSSPLRSRAMTPSRASTLPPRSSVIEPQRQLPPVPTSNLGRSSTLPMRRQPPSTESASANRASVYNPETVRARGLKHNTMSAVNMDQARPISRRMTMWEKGDPVLPSSMGLPPSAPTIKQAGKNRDSLVIQRIKAFDSREYLA